MKYWMSLCIFIALSSVACSHNGQPTESDYDDIAQALSAVVATDNGGGEVGSMSDAVNIAVGKTDITVDIDGEFLDSHLGLDYQYSVDCIDADGKRLEECGDQTDRAQAKVQWSGELQLPNLTASVERDGEWKILDVQSETVEINGNSSFDLEAQLHSIFNNVSRSYQVAYSAEYSQVKFNVSKKRAVGGSVKYVIDAQRMASGPRRESSAHFEMEGVLEFQANGKATLTLDDSYNYTVNTESGDVVKK